MKLHALFLSVATFAVLSTLPLDLKAGDFDWAIDLNLRSDANPTRYGSQLGVRFGMPDTRIREIIRRVDRPADAYIILRLSEMTSRSPDYIIREYRLKKHRDWNDFAYRLGVRPGSANDRAFRGGHDMRDDYERHDDHDRHDKKDKKHHDNRR